MAITALEFGKTLRPTTVELVTKLNETIAAVNRRLRTRRISTR